MNITRFVLMAVASATLVLAGCGKSSSVDTSGLEKNFSAAEPATKSSADKAAATIKSGDYAGGLMELKTLGAKAGLTPAQQQAVKDVVAQVEQAVKDAASKAAGEASKAAGDLQKSLTK